MRITVAAAGRLKRAPGKNLCDYYLKRTGKPERQAGISDLNPVEVSESEAGNTAGRKSQEADALLSKLAANTVLVCLNGNGEALDSEGFSGFVQKQADQGIADLCFLIGGPDGLDAALLSSATRRPCSGRMIWPHRLVRVMLAEQIYRTVTMYGESSLSSRMKALHEIRQSLEKWTSVLRICRRVDGCLMPVCQRAKV